MSRHGQGRGLLDTYRTRLQDEPFAGLVLLAGALVALVWSNSPWAHSYEALTEYVVGPATLHLDLTLGEWAADGLLAIFFFVVGLELKTEFVTGTLRDLRQAFVPILAAVFGMLGPALFYTAVQAASDSGAYHGWAVPVATDIAFAVAVLGIFGHGMPPGVRTFLLTLAVMDDLLGIVVIAIFYSGDLHLGALLGAFGVIAVFGVLVNRRVTAWWLLVPLAVLAWGLMHASGVHATIAGVLLGLTVPARTRRHEDEALTHAFTDRVQPWSAGLVLPVFAFFAAGVSVVESGGLEAMLTDPVSIGIYLGLPIGKLLGIWGGVALLIRLTRLRLGHGIDLADIVPVALVAGIGFTVSLLIASLSFDAADPRSAHARVAVLVGSLLAAVLGALALRLRVRVRIRGRGARRGYHPRRPEH
ncbi:Na+/H+ antiporter NhaA [Georgenia alba]|uniref:Na(+)/H(+) antiporter NhaA n=1 Tax=Georgenia alba TaxID=2233858 RepID=A0ABW2Q706_9MICO